MVEPECQPDGLMHDFTITAHECNLWGWALMLLTIIMMSCSEAWCCPCIFMLPHDVDFARIGQARRAGRGGGVR